MPHTKSAAKRLRQNAKRRLRNKASGSAMRSAVKKVLQAAEAGDRPQAAGLLPAAFKRIDKAAKQRVIHPNAAARKKSQVAARVQRMAASTAAPPPPPPSAEESA